MSAEVVFRRTPARALCAGVAVADLLFLAADLGLWERLSSGSTWRLVTASIAVIVLASLAFIALPRVLPASTRGDRLRAGVRQVKAASIESVEVARSWCGRFMVHISQAGGRGLGLTIPGTFDRANQDAERLREWAFRYGADLDSDDPGDTAVPFPDGTMLRPRRTPARQAWLLYPLLTFAVMGTAMVHQLSWFTWIAVAVGLAECVGLAFLRGRTAFVLLHGDEVSVAFPDRKIRRMTASEVSAVTVCGVVTPHVQLARIDGTLVRLPLTASDLPRHKRARLMRWVVEHGGGAEPAAPRWDRRPAWRLALWVVAGFALVLLPVYVMLASLIFGEVSTAPELLLQATVVASAGVIVVATSALASEQPTRPTLS